MEPAKIDWKRLEWKFVEDELYEHINAPKWVDFLAPNHASLLADDDAWFCRPDCKHPKTADDFLRSTTTTPSKLLSSVGASGTPSPLRDQNRRDLKLKRRVPTLVSSASPDGSKFRFKSNQDRENQNPNLITPPPNNLLKPFKGAFKSSEEKKKPIESDETPQLNKVPSLRSTLSAKNLFAGRPILSQITEFCNELKKLATRAKERENGENVSVKSEEEEEEEAMVKHTPAKTPPPLRAFGKSDKDKEKKPLLEVKQQTKKRPDEAENMPISLDLENVRRKKDESLFLQIRTNPPSPQCFSASGGPNKTVTSKASKSRLMERGILQEVDPKKETTTKELSPEINGRDVAMVEGREARALDVFWFLKPCTLSS